MGKVLSGKRPVAVYRRSPVAGSCAFSALTLFVGRQDGHPACKKTEWWGAGVVICLERGTDLRTAHQLMPLPLTVSCFSKIRIGFSFLVPAHLDSPGQRAVKRMCACVCVCPLAGWRCCADGTVGHGIAAHDLHAMLPCGNAAAAAAALRCPHHLARARETAISSRDSGFGRRDGR